MQSVHEYDYSTLKWVKGEINESLKAAKEALEGYFEDDDAGLMRIYLDRLHEVQGTLRVLDIEGAALLSTEMEDTGRALMEMDINADSEDHRESVVEALMRAMLQLPGYLEKVQDGHRDIPAALLTVFNDLRSSIGKQEITEADLFRPSLNITPPRTTEADTEDPRSLAKRLRPTYQTGLVTLLRGTDQQAALEKLSNVVTQLCRACALPEAGRLWWVASGFVEALQDDGIRDQKQSKTLFPKLDRQIKLLQDEGEAALSNSEATALIHKMLYLVGRSSSHGTHVEDLRSAFALDQLLPSEEEIQEFEGSLSGATVALMDTVAEALREDLHSVMEPLDVFTRSRDRNVVELRTLAQRLDDIADTLAMLGVTAGRDRLRSQAAALAEMVTGERDVTNDSLASVARSLMAVEQSLGQMSDGETEAANEGKPDPKKLRGTVMRESRNNLQIIKDQVVEFIAAEGGISLHESLKRLDEVRGSLAILGQQRASDIVLHCETYLNGALHHGNGVPEKDQIEAFAESIAGLEYYLEAVEEGLGGQKQILDAVERALAGLPQHPQVETPIDDLVANTTSLDDLHEEASDPATDQTPGEAVPLAPIDLDHQHTDTPTTAAAQAADESTKNIDNASATIPADEDDPVEIATPADTSLTEETAPPAETIDDTPPEADLADLSEADAASSDLHPSTDDAVTPRADAGSTSASAERRFKLPEVAVEHDADPELLEIFVEEATEEIESIGRNFPEWKRNPSDNEALANLRRSFHTLKGSGRMVGAWLIGEYAWAFENMFNDVLEGATPPSTEIFQLVEAGNAALPQLMDQLHTGVEPSIDIVALMDGAWAINAGEALPATSISAIAALVSSQSETPEPAAADESATDASPQPEFETASDPAETDDRDPVLMEIFQEEAVGHINSIRNYVDSSRQQASNERRISDELLRALHTIHGSGRMAEINDIADLAGGLERYIKEVAASRSAVSDAAIELLSDSAEALRHAMTTLGSTHDALPERSALLERLNQIEQTRPETRIEAASEAESHLQEVFFGDAADMLQGADENFKGWRVHPEKSDLLDALVGELDNLSDGAKLAGATTLSELAGAEKQLLQAFSTGSLGFDPEIEGLLNQTHDRLWALLESGRDGIQIADDKHLTGKLEEATALIRKSTDDTVTEVDPEVNIVDQPAEPGAPQEPLPAIPVAYEDSFPSDVDMELLEAFLEEGEDLLGSADSLISRLSVDSQNIKQIDELRRNLHTLKGGARMVGLMTMGNLSHVLESMVQGVTDGLLPASERMFDLLQMSHDTMAIMLERAREGKPLPRVEGLIDQVDGVLGNAVSEKDIEQLAGEHKSELLEKTELPEVKAPPKPEPERRGAGRVQQEQIRVRADLLNQLVNYAGEVSISRSRIEEQVSGFRFNLQELDQTVIRLRQQLRNLELETEAQILFRHETDVESGIDDFDPLEMDRYSTVQQLSRQLLESVSDFVSLHGLLLDQTREAETLLVQQSRVNTELQEGLIRTRMVPFNTLAPRLRRIVRQTSKELGKKIDLRLEGANTEVDRTVLDRMVAPLEHLLRNSVNHGIEKPKDRKKAGKPASGMIRIGLTREGQEVVITIYDDGCGLDLAKIRRKAVERGLMKKDAPLSDKEVMHFILESGFSTAGAVTQIAGRGVGMDVVNNEIKQLSGSLDINSIEGRSSTFIIRLPLTLSVSQALLVSIHEQNYAIPLSSIESVIQLSRSEADSLYAAAAPRIERGGRSYQFVPLSLLLDQPVATLQSDGDRLPVLLFSAGEINVAMSVESLLGVQEIVVKSVGAQLGRIREISGATILGDGRVVLIMNIAALLRRVVALHGTVAAADRLEAEQKITHDKVRVMVVDDSITVRKITQRLLERNGMEVITAKDGVDATTVLLEEENIPDIIITDIEMPRMDGYELATLVRNDTQLSDIPIVMITSRTGAKHRDRAEMVGVNRYLGKPFQESDLLATIDSLVQTESR